jgi:SAM-dependent methyltransferase
VLKINAESAEDFEGLGGKFDTVLMINVLEHVGDDAQTLRNIFGALTTGGRAIILVPQHPRIYGSLDKVLQHRERYTERRLNESLIDAGFRIEKIFDFNSVSVPGWWLNGRVLKRNRFSRVQLKSLDMLMPVLSRVDRFWPWSGLSLIAIAVKD